MQTRSKPRIVEEVEINLLLEGVYKIYGFDFRNYSLAYLRKRLKRLCQIESVSSISALQAKVLHDTDQVSLGRLVEVLTLTPSSMFRDPDFYMTLRESVVPLLSSEYLIRIWLPVCSTGQEAISLAILLEEEGVYDRCRIYATDSNLSALQRARTGILPLSAMRQYTENYVAAGGNRAFSEYYTANYDGSKFDPALQRNIVFGQHDLVRDGRFNEFQLVLMRNVLVHYNELLRERVLGLVHESLSPSGILALGKFETLRATCIEQSYEEIDGDHKLYRRYAA